MFPIIIHSKIKISYPSIEQLHTDTRSPGVINRSEVSIRLTPRGDLSHNTQSVITNYTPYGTSALQTELPDHNNNNNKNSSNKNNNNSNNNNNNNIITNNMNNNNIKNNNNKNKNNKNIIISNKNNIIIK